MLTSTYKILPLIFFFSSRRRHTRSKRDWSSDVCSSDLVEAEARRAERSPDPDSTDLYFRARALMNRGSTAEYLKPAEALLERALALDPDNVDALAATGWVNMQFGAGFMTDDRTTRLAAAEATAIKA